MAFAGDNSQWLGFFRESLIPEVLALILQGWGDMPLVGPDAKEVETTRRLREVLRQIKQLRRLPFTIWPESSETNPATGREIGRLDLRFLHGYREDVYLSFECKRLYYQDDGGKRHANVSAYTGKDGLMCYITQKYGRGLRHGGMIGYVLDGDIPKAKAQINRSMGNHRERLRLLSNPPLQDCAYFPTDNRCAESLHKISDMHMTIYHILLAN